MEDPELTRLWLCVFSIRQLLHHIGLDAMLSEDIACSSIMNESPHLTQCVPAGLQPLPLQCRWHQVQAPQCLPGSHRAL